MQLVIVAVGSRMPTWVDLAFGDYAGRMPPELKIVLKEIRPEPRTAGKTVDAMISAEGERVRLALPKHGLRIALDERGRDLTSTELATLLGSWRADGDDVSFLIGGPDGLDPSVKAEAQMRMKLSSLTLPHGMARVLLAEQLYRAWSITQNHPYHRA
ncbi:MAG: 23S rRNA (pseudouridine(1915)-N(3))-methyltransferase RlmH [Burkholderiaceae bacterium]